LKVVQTPETLLNTLPDKAKEGGRGGEKEGERENARLSLVGDHLNLDN